MTRNKCCAIIRAVLPVLVICSHSALRAQPTAPRRAIVETLRLDGERNLFTRIVSIRVKADSTILVAELDRVHVFNWRGQRLRFIGRMGRGPGEFLRINGVGVSGDSVWISDTQMNRITIFDGKDSSVRTARIDSSLLLRPAVTAAGGRLTSPPVAPLLSWAPPAALYSDGSMLMIPRKFFVCPKSQLLDTVPLMRTTPSGEVLEVLRQVEIPTNSFCLPGTRRSVQRTPIADGPFVSVSVDGRRLLHTSHRYEAGRGFLTVALFDDKGRTLYSREFSLTPRPVAAYFKDSVIQYYASRIEGVRNVTEAARLAVPFPPAQPAVSATLVDRDGTAWLRESRDLRTFSWVVLDPLGNPIASIPEPLRTQFIGLDRGLWAIQTDDNGVQSVVKYSFVR